MAEVTLEKVWEEVQELPSDDQQQLWKKLDEMLDGSARSKEEELQRKLLEAGLISEIKPPITDFTPYQNRRPIEVKGKPVSETIIEERR